MRDMYSSPAHNSESQVHEIADGRIKVYAAEDLAVIDGVARLDITGHQLGMLTLLATEAGSIVPRERVGEAVWGNYDDSVRSRMRTHMHRLRAKLGADDLGSPRGGAIQTVDYIGYRARKFLDAKNEPDEKSITLGNGRVAVDPEAFSIFCDGYLLEDVSKSEFTIMSVLAHRADELVGVPELQEALWGFAGGAAAPTIRQHVRSLRFLFALSSPELGDPKTGVIRNAYGRGYWAATDLGQLSLSTGH